MNEIKVRKRDSGLEEWSDDKLIASIMKPGVPGSDAKSIAEAVKEWVKSNNKDGVITSVQIRDRVIELMGVDFPAEADSYQAFKK